MKIPWKQQILYKVLFELHKIWIHITSRYKRDKMEAKNAFRYFPVRSTLIFDNWKLEYIDKYIFSELHHSS